MSLMPWEYKEYILLMKSPYAEFIAVQKQQHEIAEWHAERFGAKGFPFQIVPLSEKTFEVIAEAYEKKNLIFS